MKVLKYLYKIAKTTGQALQAPEPRPPEPHFPIQFTMNAVLRNNLLPTDALVQFHKSFKEASHEASLLLNELIPARKRLGLYCQVTNLYTK